MDWFLYFFMAWMRELVCLHDLGEELLRVAPDLHGGLGADMLCTNGDEKRGERSVAWPDQPCQEQEQSGGTPAREHVPWMRRHARP